MHFAILIAILYCRELVIFDVGARQSAFTEPPCLESQKKLMFLEWLFGDTTCICALFYRWSYRLEPPPKSKPLHMIAVSKL